MLMKRNVDDDVRKDLSLPHLQNMLISDWLLDCKFCPNIDTVINIMMFSQIFRTFGKL